MRWRRCQSISAATAVPGDGGAAPAAAMCRIVPGVSPLRVSAIATAAAGEDEAAGIAGLAAPHGIEDGAVELDRRPRHPGDGRLAVPGIGPVAEDELGHGPASSQRGTGSSFSRRKAGLNSLLS